MDKLKEKILTEGKVLPGNILKVDMFLNHQVDYQLLKEAGLEFYNFFKDCGVNKILTIEASGIAVACAVADAFKIPFVFAKKGSHSNVGSNVYTSEVFSYTKGKSYTLTVSKDYINKDDRILIVDDFLANGEAVLGLKRIIDEAGGELCGVGIIIEKRFQNGYKKLVDAGIKLKSLAVIESMNDGNIVFG